MAQRRRHAFGPARPVSSDPSRPDSPSRDGYPREALKNEDVENVFRRLLELYKTNNPSGEVSWVPSDRDTDWLSKYPWKGEPVLRPYVPPPPGWGPDPVLGPGPDVAQALRRLQQVEPGIADDLRRIDIGPTSSSIYWYGVPTGISDTKGDYMGHRRYGHYAPSDRSIGLNPRIGSGRHDESFGSPDERATIGSVLAHELEHHADKTWFVRGPGEESDDAQHELAYALGYLGDMLVHGAKTPLESYDRSTYNPNDPPNYDSLPVKPHPAQFIALEYVNNLLREIPEWDPRPISNVLMQDLSTDYYHPSGGERSLARTLQKWPIQPGEFGLGEITTSIQDASEDSGLFYPQFGGRHPLHISGSGR